MRRLDQWLANLGYCSRRAARDFLREHQVTLVPSSGAGQPAPSSDSSSRLLDPARKVAGGNVRVDGEPLDHPDGVLVMLHKPVGLVCSHDAREGPSVYDLLPARWVERNPQVTSVGRLDKETSGLLLLTDLSELVHRLTSPRHHVEKQYRATVDRDLPADSAARFASGTLLLDGEPHPCAPAVLCPLGPREATVVLTEGRYHQVRRMFAAVGVTVVSLHRERFGALSLGDLPAGQLRELPLDTFSAH